MGYELENNVSPRKEWLPLVIIVKFKRCCAIRICIRNTKDIPRNSYQILQQILTRTVKMSHHVEIDKTESFLRAKPYPFQPKAEDHDRYRYLKYYHPLGAPSLPCQIKFVSWLLRKRNIGFKLRKIETVFSMNKVLNPPFLDLIYVFLPFKVPRVVNFNLVFTDYFFYKLLVLIKLCKIRYLN